VVAAYGLILPPAVLEAPRLGCWNIHASLLPRWRGAAPIHRALLAGDALTGITIMQMDAGLDTGPMLLERPVPIGAREDGGSLHDRLAALGAEAIVAAIAGFLAGRLAPVPQPAEGVTYASKIRKDEARIDWTAPADAIDRQVRAFNPWPVAETSWQDRQLRVWAADPVPESSGEPGEVLEAAGGRIVVATGEGALGLTRVQLAGRRAMTAAEFLNAHSLAGARLG
jgi:methionyl-tRNA formyltransferase